MLVRRALSAGAMLGLLARSSNALAQAAPDHERSGEYYAVHGAIIGALGAGRLATQFWSRPGAGSDFAWFPGDESVRGRHSPAAAELSNVFIGLTVAEPMFTQLGRGVDAHLANFGVIYGEAVMANLFLNGLVKLAVGRPRPYTYGLAEAEDDDPSDRNVSFYSGHSSTAFAAAVSGSLLYAESAPDRASKLVVWGSQFALAGATANLRVRAGKHYYSDVTVGALVGSGIGLVLPVLHGGHYAPGAAEYLAAGGGLLLGVAISEFMPRTPDSQRRHTATSWSLAPWGTTNTLGLAAQGAF